MPYGDVDTVSQLKIAVDTCDYELLIHRQDIGDCCTGAGGDAMLTSYSSSRSCSSDEGGCVWWWWAKVFIMVIVGAVLGVCFFIWVGPFLMNKVLFFFKAFYILFLVMFHLLNACSSKVLLVCYFLIIYTV